MTTALIQHVQWNGSNGGTSLGVDTTGANLIVMHLSYDNTGAKPTPTDSRGNTYVPLTPKVAGIKYSRLYYCINPSVGTGHTFTVATGEFFTGDMQAFSGANGGYDGENGNTSAISAIQPGSVTPSAAGAVIVTGFSGSNGTAVGTIDSGFTITDQRALNGTGMGAGMAYLVQGSAGAVNPTWVTNDLSANTSATISVFLAGASTPAPTLSSPTATGGTLTGNGGVTTDTGSGTLWWNVDTSATATDPGSGSEAGAGWTSQTVSSTGAQTVASFGALTAGTKYAHYLHVAAGGRSTVANSASFVVAAGGTAPSFTVQPSNQSGTVGGTATFGFTVAGSGSLTVQAKKGGVNVYNDGHCKLVLYPIFSVQKKTVAAPLAGSRTKPRSE